MIYYRKRKIIDKFMRMLIMAGTFFALVPLFSIFAYIISKGIGSINLDFFTQLPKPVGETGGGMSNAIFGSFILVGFSSLWAIPVGIFGGIYLSEFGGNRIGKIIRFSADVLSGVPSIVIGIFAYALFVRPMKTFSAISGAFALGVIMVPTIMRTTEEMVKLVPQTLREAGLALGLTRFRTTLSIVMKTAMPGVITGVMLAVARVAGETAPLLFTAFGNRFSFNGLGGPVAALPLQIFVYAVSPFEDWQKQAWAGACVLILFVFSISLISRLVTRQR